MRYEIRFQEVVQRSLLVDADSASEAIQIARVRREKDPDDNHVRSRRTGSPTWHFVRSDEDF